MLERSLVDKWVKSDDQHSFTLARRLIREEGLLCGGSSGAALQGALEAAKTLKKGQRCVVILPDSVRNYMTKFLSDDWMKESGFLPKDAKDVTTKPAAAAASAASAPAPAVAEDPYKGATIADLKLPNAITISPEETVQHAVEIMREKGFDQLPVVKNGKPVGLVTLGNLLSRVSSNRLKFTDPISVGAGLFQYAKKGKDAYLTITPATKLNSLNHFFEENSVAFVTHPEGGLVSVVTKIDLLSYLLQH